MKQVILGNIKDFGKLVKSFDNVRHDTFDEFQQLTLSNNVNGNGCIKEVVYLQINIALDNGNRDAQELLQCAVKDIIPWLDLLVKCDAKETTTSLFGNNEIELEVEPKSPSDGEEGTWGKYFKESERVKISNLKKQYSFFELFDPLKWYWTYNKFNIQKFIPTHDDLLEIIKNAIIKVKDKPGRYEDIWFDNDRRYISKKALSDNELYTRVMNSLRLYLVPFYEDNGVYFDDGYTKHSEPSRKINHMFYFCRGLLELHYSGIKNSVKEESFPLYDFYTVEFVAFLREQFKTEEKAALTDNDAIDLALMHVASGINPLWQELLNKSISMKDFKKNLFSEVDKTTLNIRSLYTDDGYAYTIGLDKNKPSIVIEQRVKSRKRLNYSFDSDIDNSTFNYYLFTIEGDEVYKEIFDRFKVEDNSVVQTTFFDFIAA